MSAFLGRGALIADGLTLARNFSPWFAGVAAVSLLTGIGLGAYGGIRWQAGQVAQAERRADQAKAALDAYRASVETAVAEGQAAGAYRVAQALHEQAERDRRVSAAVAMIPTEVARLLAPDLVSLRRSLDDPRLACLDEPLPPAALRLLERPGGRAGAADHH